MIKSPYSEKTIHSEKLEFVAINLSWSVRNTFGNDFDLDLSCFLLNSNGIVTTEQDFVFYNNSTSSCGSATYLGDNRLGEMHAQDSETINLDLPKLKKETNRVAIAVSIYEAEQRNQIFGLVNDARLEIINRRNNKLIAVFDLAEAFREEKAIIVCELYKCGDNWKFRSIDREYRNDLSEIAQIFGIK